MLESINVLLYSQTFKGEGQKFKDKNYELPKTIKVRSPTNQADAQSSEWTSAGCATVY